MGDETVSVGTVMRELYAANEAPFLRWVSQFAGSGYVPRCEKGCAHCCELLALITWPEAFAIAEDLQARGLVREYAPRLAEQARRAMETGDQVTYFQARVPCALLEPDKTCAVYDARPSTCRYHVAFSEPADCGSRVPDAPTITANSVEIQRHVLWPIIEELVKKTGEEALQLAPIPVMVLAALKALRAEVEQPVPPMVWITRWARTVADYQRAKLGKVVTVAP